MKSIQRIKSELFSLNKWDAIKTAILTILSGFFTALINIWAPGTFPTKIQVLSVLGITALSYISKQFFTNSQGLPKPEPKTPTDETFNSLTDSPDSRV